MSFTGNPTCICPKCDKRVKVHAVKNDWSNCAYPVNHKDKEGKKCDGQFYDVSDDKLTWPEPK